MVLLKSAILKLSQKPPKSKFLNTFFQPKDLKLRPIVAGRKCLTKRLNYFVYILPKLLLSKVKCYVKDDFDFLKKLKRNSTKNSKLVFFDVTRFYTNIEHELELKAIEYLLDKYPEFISSRFSKYCFLEALKLFLKITFFFLTNNIFIKSLELLGVLNAPTDATIIMEYIEIYWYEKRKNEFGVKNGKYIK